MTGSDGTTNGSHDVVAVTKAGDLDLPPPVAGLPKNLPNEVLLMIFKTFKKDQLKAVRCVCKLFAQLVAPRLFDEVYISPHRLNMDVFRQIAEHQELCRYPRTLIYDLQEFKNNINPKEYYKKLCYQLHYFLTSYPKSTIEHVDKELEGLLHLASVSAYPAQDNPEGFDAFSSCRIVQRGLELYAKKAEEQVHYNNGELLGCLCMGLMRLTNIDKVRFNCYWPDSHLRSSNWNQNPRDLHFASGPLARSWSPFHLKPGSSHPCPYLPDSVCTVEFDNVISAFSLTGRPLRELDAYSRPFVAYEIFHSNSLSSHTFRQHSLPSTHYLEYLSLKIDTRHHSKIGSGEFKFRDPKEKTLSVDLLGIAFHHMPRLRSLSVHGSGSDSLLSISELFQTVTLPALEVLDLNGMLGSAADICAFLRAQPRLIDLCIGRIELSEGTWAELADDMRRWLHLDSLNWEYPLRENGGVDLWNEDSWIDCSCQISYYVRYEDGNEGKNPLRSAKMISDAT